ncbi:MAG: S8 family serine peptidase [Isosphaeraceae bacterium]|nr:S8 family serine peptidase [Isosphaeraceae bacterium]
MKRRDARPMLVELEPRLVMDASSSPIPPLPRQPVNVGSVRSYYGLDQIQFPQPGGGTIAGDGRGQTVAIVMTARDASYTNSSDPNWLSSGLAQYSIANGLPYNQAGTNSDFSFTLMNQWGDTDPSHLPAPGDLEGAIEFDIDTQAVHSLAPRANIVVVVPQSGSDQDFYQAVKTAISLRPAAISLSWDGNETQAATTNPWPFEDGLGITYVVASGDTGAGMQYDTSGQLAYHPMAAPADNPLVVQVGGTRLIPLSDGSFQEVAWGNGAYSLLGHEDPSQYSGGGGTSGGYSLYISRPDYQAVSPFVRQNQAQFPAASATQRLGPDVCMESSPGLPILRYDPTTGTHEWSGYGGTSIAAPMFAGVMAIVAQGRALADRPALSASDTLHFLYQLPSRDFTDITQGNTGYPALPGYDLASGRGAVRAAALVNDLVNATYPTRTIADFDGDGQSDITVYRPETGQWLISYSGGGAGIVTYGAPNLDQPVPADYDGDGRSDFAVYRPTTGQWLISYSSGGSAIFTLGAPSIDQPNVGDYDGDGRIDLGVYRPTTGQWLIALSSGGSEVLSYGAPGTDVPAGADYDGDGRTDFAVYRPTTGQWLIVLSGSGTAEVLSYGVPNLDIPVTGDYDGDGKADIAVYRPTTGQWLISYSNGGSAILSYGAPGVDVAIPGPMENGQGPKIMALAIPEASAQQAAVLIDPMAVPVGPLGLSSARRRWWN